jgi:glyceraldehyde-3-phosphate dehydrogenase (NADP+)
MYVAGSWTDAAQSTPVVSPYSGETVDAVPVATTADAARALSAAQDGARAMARLSAYERMQILQKTADLLAARTEDFARIISLEVGKPLKESRGEAGRMPDLLRLCAFEGAQLRGETLPLDAHVNTKGKIGLTLRVPCGIVVAITPFNYPLLLVVHKVGPALAAGNSVILKPATQTPLSALRLTELFLQAGLPPNALQCLTGKGGELGTALCRDRRVRKITFTGSTAVGERIAAVAGVKKLSLELGSNAPLIILPDADLEAAVQATAVGGYVNAGQVCISTQRVIVHRRVYAPFVEALKPRVDAIKVGPSLEEGTELSAMISEAEAKRVKSWVDESVEGGARIVTGGRRDGAVLRPTIVADVKPAMKLFREEVFGPLVGLTPVETIDEAIAVANDSPYGLGAGVFTRDVGNAWRFAREVESGNVMINWSPLWRADFMPYGGFKGSGIGKEGPRYAIEEMTETKTVVFHGIGA